MEDTTYHIAVYVKSTVSSDTLLSEQLVNPSDEYLKGYLTALKKVYPNHSIIHNKI